MKEITYRHFIFWKRRIAVRYPAFTSTLLIIQEQKIGNTITNARIAIAKKLLTPDGVFICAIDENELATVLMLIEDVFGASYKSDIVAVVHNPRGVQGDNFSYVNEYAIFTYKKGMNVISTRAFYVEEIDW